ncbi:HET-domain-containing protein [Hypoxylon rubiginosum]|uniref:HET-domain-containing protein n=1 Tax=Hypoxylon rubiginosum TaxID=110542 RepID=A0ACC0DLZ7_9PEZI|nr:HET-domain-containing protein [Hypoxylon rubiginosum]
MYMRVGNRQGGFEMEPFNFSDVQLNLDISPSTGDEATWRITQGWLKECTETHTSCNPGGITSYIPSRLVELDDSAAEPTFRVVEKHQVDPQSQYLTLSHCWGVESMKDRLTLTHSTVEALSKEQPCSMLPKTYRDALIVAGRLGIRYVWIDSLCISQDSVEDWRAESSSMQEVYGNAFMSITALGADDDGGGLFFSRDPDMVKPTVFKFGVDGPENPQPYRFSLEKGWAWRLSFNNEPLTKRGWVIQERLLPRRVLHFGSKQVFWECYEGARCETHPKTVDCIDLPQTDKTKEVDKPNHAWKDLIGASHRFECKDDISQLFVDWYSLLHLYSNCNLTVAGDKLVALSGIAKDMKQRLSTLGCQDTKYLAGIWSQRLPQALIWNVRTAGRRVEVYRAPSWSWAAIDGDINIHDWSLATMGNMEILASVISAQTTTAKSGDETGEVTGGTITLGGIMLTANLGPYVKTELHIFFETTRDVAEFRHPKNGTLRTRIQGGGNTTKDNFIKSSVRFDTMEDVSTQVACLPITKTESTFNGITTWHVAGLAVKEVEDGNYRRVGHFSMEAKREEEIRSIFEEALRGYFNII